MEEAQFESTGHFDFVPSQVEDKLAHYQLDFTTCLLFLVRVALYARPQRLKLGWKGCTITLSGPEPLEEPEEPWWENPLSWASQSNLKPPRMLASAWLGMRNRGLKNFSIRWKNRVQTLTGQPAPHFSKKSNGFLIECHFASASWTQQERRATLVQLFDFQNYLPMGIQLPGLFLRHRQQFSFAGTEAIGESPPSSIGENVQLARLGIVAEKGEVGFKTYLESSRVGWQHFLDGTQGWVAQLGTRGSIVFETIRAREPRLSKPPSLSKRFFRSLIAPFSDEEEWQKHSMRIVCLVTHSSTLRHSCLIPMVRGMPLTGNSGLLVNLIPNCWIFAVNDDPDFETDISGRYPLMTQRLSDWLVEIVAEVLQQIDSLRQKVQDSDLSCLDLPYGREAQAQARDEIVTYLKCVQDWRQAQGLSSAEG